MPMFLIMPLKYGSKIKNIQIVRHPVSAGEDSKTDLIYHPRSFYQCSMVFIPQDKRLSLASTYISQSYSLPKICYT